MRRQVVRTVRGGAVVIGGRRYRPQQRYMAYDGRCDGHRFLFGRYRRPGGGWEPYVSICTTEAALRGEADPLTGPDVVDGTMPWLFWDEVPS